MTDTHDTIDGLLAEFRGYSYGMPPSYHVTMSWHDFRVMLDRFEAAHKREIQTIIDEANEDTALVKNCATCKHYCRNKKYCPAQDTVNVNPDILPIFRTGPCDKWKCKYTYERHPRMSWGKCVDEYQKSKADGEYGPY